jgi:hypothetical protein
MTQTRQDRDAAIRERNQPPAETGQRLAVFPRSRDQELRVSLAEYGGHDYVSLRVWAMDQDGQWWPVRGKGCSVRLSEIGGLIDALCQVEERSMPPARYQPQDDDRGRVSYSPSRNL